MRKFWRRFLFWLKRARCASTVVSGANMRRYVAMTKEEFTALIGQDLVVDYPFGKELQQWSMKTFYIDENGEIKHNRLPLIMDVFIPNARNPHKGKPTHG